MIPGPALTPPPAVPLAKAVPHPVTAAEAILDQGRAFLESLPREAYLRRHPRAFDATVGCHLRHCLDHFTSVIRALDSGEVDYDRRDRDPRIEADPEFALRTLGDLRRALGHLNAGDLEGPVTVRCAVTYEGAEAPPCASTLGRELVYAIAHAVHHFALIAFLAREMGAPVPDRFGLAPSTARHLARTGAPAA